jgi:hypothetical protein
LARPRFSARALPPLSKLISVTRGSSAKALRTTSAVWSAEPSSSTSTSSRDQLEARIRRTELSITFSSLKQGISTLISGPVTGSGMGGVRRVLVKRWISARTPSTSSRATPRTMATMNRVCSATCMPWKKPKPMRSSSNSKELRLVGGSTSADVMPARSPMVTSL